MVRTRKVSVSLPEPVFDWLQEVADQNFVTAPEYICRLVIDFFVGRDGKVQGSTSASISGSNSVKKQDPRSPSETRFKGVYRYGKRWAAWIWDSGGKRMQRLGTFDTPEDAARAYDLAALARNGERTNLPDERDLLLKTAEPFLDRLSSEGLSDDDWSAWRAATGAPGRLPGPPPSMTTPVLASPDGHDREPLVLSTPVSLYRRGDPPK